MIENAIWELTKQARTEELSVKYKVSLLRAPGSFVHTAGTSIKYWLHPAFVDRAANNMLRSATSGDYVCIAGDGRTCSRKQQPERVAIFLLRLNTGTCSPVARTTAKGPAYIR
jgi:hypothetical protein